MKNMQKSACKQTNNKKKTDQLNKDLAGWKKQEKLGGVILPVRVTHAMAYSELHVLDPDLTSFMPGVIVGAAMKTT